jgi:hypothetical protein
MVSEPRNKISENNHAPCQRGASAGCHIGERTVVVTRPYDKEPAGRQAQDELGGLSLLNA